MCNWSVERYKQSMGKVFNLDKREAKEVNVSRRVKVVNGVSRVIKAFNEFSRMCLIGAVEG